PPNTCCLFSSLIPLPPTSTLFPYTTLFRSVISKYEVIPMKKMRLIGTIIGVAGAIGAVAAIVYKKFKEKQAMVNTPQEKTLLLGNTSSKAKSELMKAELSEKDQVETNNTEIPHVSLDDDKPRIFEDK